MKLPIAISTSPAFIAFNAHCWFAFAFLAVLMPLIGWPAVGVAFAIAWLKEFWFDARYEVPAQTLLGSLEDFAGYSTGIIFSIVWHWHGI